MLCGRAYRVFAEMSVQKVNLSLFYLITWGGGLDSHVWVGWLLFLLGNTYLGKHPSLAMVDPPPPPQAAP